MENTTVTQGKTTAIISYITFIGTIIAIVMNNDKKNSFASFHIRQALGLALLQLIAYALRIYLGLGLLGWFLGVAVFVLIIIGVLGALQGEEKKVPFLGDQFQEWFKQIG